MTQFPFNDLHSFKDFVVFVRMCAPDRFPQRHGVLAEDQWTVELAFKGLGEGLALSISEKGNRPQFERVRQLFEKAAFAYRLGGFKTLDEAHRVLHEVPSR